MKYDGNVEQYPHRHDSPKFLFFSEVTRERESERHGHLSFNPLNAGLNPICHLLGLLAHHIFHVSGLGLKYE
jgi:hypothetical protein